MRAGAWARGKADSQESEQNQSDHGIAGRPILDSEAVRKMSTLARRHFVWTRWVSVEMDLIKFGESHTVKSDSGDGTGGCLLGEKSGVARDTPRAGTLWEYLREVDASSRDHRTKSSNSSGDPRRLREGVPAHDSPVAAGG